MRVSCAIFVLAVGCGGGDELTCELLADEGNCWATAAAELAACMPGRATPATLEADRGSCTFADGVTVVFDTPLPMDTQQLERLEFSVMTNGSECGRFVDTFMNRMELTGGGETVVSELLPGSEFHLRCADGDFSSSFDLLFDCAAMGIPAPTDGFEVTPTSFAFTVTSVSTPGELFRCELP
jgi:hypothetical protein